MNKIGIRNEDKYSLERRTPLVPADVTEMISYHGIPIFLESSSKRIFTDKEYEMAGAYVTGNLEDCDVILGVKEMPETFFKKDKTYVFFSHVIKGQLYNMPMLSNLKKAGSTLIDYEKIADSNGQRLIFFGRYAGLAGMINTLWALGQRYKELGYNTPFESLKQANRYASLEEAKNDIFNVGELLTESELPSQLQPLVIAITGDGNVSKGAIEILELLPGEEITADQLKYGNIPATGIVKVNILPEDYLVHRKGSGFQLLDYIKNPQNYKSEIERLLPEINVFVNGIYWDERYPRLIKKSWLQKMNKKSELKLNVIGDITCDVHGSIECTEMATEIEDPVFIYNPTDDTHHMGFHGKGIAVMAVDILPSELPREASEHFSSALKPFIKSLAIADFSVEFEDLDLPVPLKKAIIVYKGRLTDDYKYLEKFI
jgi:alanine dehydrogenase